MQIKPDEKYIIPLTKLWQEVFGDDEEYISLFFKRAFFDSECFAYAENEEIISALYLLKSNISYCGKIYRGRYLYAAATAEKYRGRGLMSCLISEAEAYVRSQELDFIALVPADESLYDYYKRFSYEPLMYKYCINLDDCCDVNGTKDLVAKTKDEFYLNRKSTSCDMLFYDRVISDYAYDCLSFCGQKVISLSDKSYYINSQELFCGDGDEKSCLDALKTLKLHDKYVFSNCDFGYGEKAKNGMLLAVNDELKNKEIYMNIALD